MSRKTVIEDGMRGIHDRLDDAYGEGRRSGLNDGQWMLEALSSVVVPNGDKTAQWIVEEAGRRAKQLEAMKDTGGLVEAIKARGPVAVGNPREKLSQKPAVHRHEAEEG